MGNISNCKQLFWTHSFTNSNSRHVKATYQCNICDKTFHGSKNTARQYQLHLKTHDVTPRKRGREKMPERSYVCMQCEKSFPFLSYLNRHIERSHSSQSKKMPNLDLNALKDPTVSNAQFVSELFHEENEHEENIEENENEEEEMPNEKIDAPDVEDVKISIDQGDSTENQYQSRSEPKSKKQKHITVI
jgi:DNA-directed RNA polymerase subunit RPC12/RpoP